MSAVTIENHDGRYRLRWLHQGKRYTMSCGVPATPTGKAIAKQKAAQIELDISAGYFDPTLLKYKPKTIGKNATELTVPELFRKFTDHHRISKGLAPGSMRRYVCVQAHVLRRLNVDAQTVCDRHAGHR
jgi:integrase